MGLNRDETRVVLSLGGYFAWLLCFAMFGPALGVLVASAQANLPGLLQVFLPVHGLSLLLLGLYGYAQKPYARIAQRAAVVLCAGLTIAIAYTPPTMWVYLLCALAVTSALPVIGYAPHLARTARLSHRARTIGCAMGFANLLLYAISVSMPKIAALGSGVPAIMSATFLILPAVVDLRLDGPRYEEETRGTKPFSLTWHLVYLLVAFYLVGGLAYQLVYPPATVSGAAIMLIGVLPYIAVTVALGGAIDRTGQYGWIVPVGVALMGSSIALYNSANKLAVVVVSHILIQAGYGVADLFLWTYLTHSAQPGLESKQFGIGLALNVGSICLGLLISQNRLPLLDLPARTAAVTGIVFLFLAVAVWSRMPVPKSRQKPSMDLSEMARTIMKDYSLTSRQEEICLLLLQGLSNDEISERLHISPNTLKTHLRNLYSKTGTANRKDLILLVASETPGKDS